MQLQVERWRAAIVYVSIQLPGVPLAGPGGNHVVNAWVDGMRRGGTVALWSAPAKIGKEREEVQEGEASHG